MAKLSTFVQETLTEIVKGVTWARESAPDGARLIDPNAAGGGIHHIKVVSFDLVLIPRGTRSDGVEVTEVHVAGDTTNDNAKVETNIAAGNRIKFEVNIMFS